MRLFPIYIFLLMVYIPKTDSGYIIIIHTLKRKYSVIRTPFLVSLCLSALAAEGAFIHLMSIKVQLWILNHRRQQWLDLL